MKILLAAAGGLVLLGAAAVASLDRLSIAYLTPPSPFDATAAPAPPDYGDAAAWSAHPERRDAADVVLEALADPDRPALPADVFYVHPTSYLGRNWNGPVNDASLNTATDQLSTLIQASAFNGCCAVYAPRYRQANGTALTHPSADGQRAMDLAYQDVAEAFRTMLSQSGERPFVIASHSQGTAYARRLLREEVSGTALRERLVVAYLVGLPLPEDELAHELPDLPVCAQPSETGCLVSWNARAPDYRPKLEARETGRDPATPASSGPSVCVNPLSWRDDERGVEARHNPGAVFLHADPSGVKPAFASARCADGVLQVEELGEVPRDFMSRLLDFAMGPGNYHPIEYQLFYLSLRENARVRTAVHLGLSEADG